jgi:ascorbate-specific PTS system EIIC-type component UlaA
MTTVSLDSLLALGLLLGLRHATEADHLAAISTIVTERRSLLSSSLIGAFWGLGHTLALLIAGVGVLLLRYQLTDRIVHALELGVGVMLVLLGADVLRKLVRSARHTHEHAVVGPHAHPAGKLVSRPLFVGMVHGLAGSAPLLLLALTVMSSPLAAFSYIAVFGLGSVMGMTIMSLLVSVPARLTAEFARTNLALRGLSGMFSVGLGIVIVYQNALLYRLAT